MPTESASAGEIQVFRRQANSTQRVVGLNIAGVTDAESLVHPDPGGNCLNWVLGHLLWVYDRALPLLGQQPVMQKGRLDRYARGGAPLTDGAEAIPFTDLVAAWTEASNRVDAGLAALDPNRLDRPAPDSTSGDPNETVRTLLSTIFFHQAYHAGQTGVLRRVTGKPGAIA